MVLSCCQEYFNTNQPYYFSTCFLSAPAGLFLCFFFSQPILKFDAQISVLSTSKASWCCCCGLELTKPIHSLLYFSSFALLFSFTHSLTLLRLALNPFAQIPDAEQISSFVLLFALCTNFTPLIRVHHLHCWLLQEENFGQVTFPGTWGFFPNELATAGKQIRGNL